MKRVLTVVLSLLTLLPVSAQFMETDQPVSPPVGLWTDAYTLEYTLSEVSSQAGGSGIVNIGIDNVNYQPYGHVYQGDVYLQGLCQQLPEAWVKAHIDGEIAEYEIMPGSIEVYCRLRLSLPQYLGTYGETGALYLTAFDEETGEPLSEMEFEYRPFYNIIEKPSAPLCISTSTTEKCSLQEYTSMSMVFDVKVIENTPEGLLRIYNRTGGVVKEVERVPANENNPYIIVNTEQSGTINIVFADNHKVYLQQPVSELTVYSAWVEGTLSDDGTTITVPMGQYIAYTRRFNMGVQPWVCTYDEALESFVPDPSIKEVTYTIEGDEIHLNGTSETCGLGCVNRTFGLVFSYLNGEWLQTCDYATVYTLFDETPLEAPEDLQTETYHLATCYFIAEWLPLDIDVEIGFQGDEVWLKGICQYLPNAWIKGWRNGDQLVFPSEQYLGSVDGVPAYFKDVAVENGKTVVKNMELTFDGNDTYTTTDYIFIVTARGTLEYLNYYMGVTLSQHEDEVTTPPDGLTSSYYTFSYETVVDDSGNRIAAQHNVMVACDETDVYIRGLWEGLPDAWVKGTLNDDNQLVFSLPQYMGVYSDEYLGNYPIYLTAFDENTGMLFPELTFNCSQYTTLGGAMYIDQPSHPISIGICKTGYLGLQDFYDGVIAKGNPTGLDNNAQYSMFNAQCSVFDLHGRKWAESCNHLSNRQLFNSSTSSKGVLIVRQIDGSVRKVLVK